MKSMDRQGFINLLKSQKGGISHVVSEITIAVLVLSLMIVVIFAFRGSMDAVGYSADKSNSLGKMKAEALVPLDRNVVRGGDVISVIRYYFSSGANVAVYVTAGGSSHTYLHENYDSGVFTIPRNMEFEAAYDYSGDALVSITYVPH